MRVTDETIKFKIRLIKILLALKTNKHLLSKIFIAKCQAFQNFFKFYP